MFELMGKKIFTILHANIFATSTYVNSRFCHQVFSKVNPWLVVGISMPDPQVINFSHAQLN